MIIAFIFEEFSPPQLISSRVVSGGRGGVLSRLLVRVISGSCSHGGIKCGLFDDRREEFSHLPEASL